MLSYYILEGDFMPIKIAVCDDAAEDTELLTKALSTYDPLIEIFTYPSGKALVDEFLDADSDIDLLFLDIYMPGIDGITTAQKIHVQYPKLKIIFLSSSKDHYLQAYEVFAFNYILKPFDRERLYAVLDRAIDEIGKEQGRKICIQYKSSVHSVDCRDICYIESRDRLLLFHLSNGETLQCYEKMDEMIQELPEQFFIRCHQSFIVNVRHVTEMGENHFRIGQVVIGISRKYLKLAKDQYYGYLFSHLDGEQPL
jgi:DNA-binding LytR/AlgR family response regulator